MNIYNVYIYIMCIYIYIYRYVKVFLLVSMIRDRRLSSQKQCDTPVACTDQCKLCLYGRMTLRGVNCSQVQLQSAYDSATCND